MRHKQSLVWPLILLLLGTLLLIRNFHPEFPFWDLVGKYWPVFLIVWGIVKLAGALRPVPAGAAPWCPSLSVGEFFLALLIVFIGLSASKWVEVRREIPWGDINWELPWFQSYSFTQALKQPMEPKSSLSVENSRGDVHVTGGDTKDITVTVTKQVRAGSEQEAKGISDRVLAELTRDGSAYVIRINSDNRLRADMDIVVPKDTPVRFDLHRGSVQASDVGEVNAQVERGDVSVSNVNGNVRLAVRRGSLSAQNIKGNVDLDGRGSDIQVSDVTGQLFIRGDYSGASDYTRVAQGVKFTSSRTDMEIQKLPGRVEMTLGSLVITEPGGMVTVNTRNKDIRIEEFSEKVQISDRDASIELRTSKLPLKDIDIENHSGPIEVSLPAKSEFQVDATARRGEVDSEFSGVETTQQNDSGSIKGKIGQAGGTLKLVTSYGAIRLKKIGAGTEATPGPGLQLPPPKPPKESKPQISQIPQSAVL